MDEDALAAQLTHDYDGATHGHTLEQLLSKASGEEAGPKIRQFLTAHPNMVVNAPSLMMGTMLQEFKNKKLMDELVGRETGEMAIMAPTIVMYDDLEGGDSVVRVMSPTNPKRRRGRRTPSEEINQLLVEVATTYYYSQHLQVKSSKIIAKIEEAVEELEKQGDPELTGHAQDLKAQAQQIKDDITAHQQNLQTGNANEAEVETIQQDLHERHGMLSSLWTKFKTTVASVMPRRAETTPEIDPMEDRVDDTDSEERAPDAPQPTRG
jgi:hypothetical protein